MAGFRKSNAQHSKSFGTTEIMCISNSQRTVNIAEDSTGLTYQQFRQNDWHRIDSCIRRRVCVWRPQMRPVYLRREARGVSWRRSKTISTVLRKRSTNVSTSCRIINASTCGPKKRSSSSCQDINEQFDAGDWREYFIGTVL